MRSTSVWPLITPVYLLGRLGIKLKPYMKMKLLLFGILILVSQLRTQAQINQRDWLIGGRGTLGLVRVSQSSRPSISGELSPSALYFVSPRIAVGAMLSAGFSTGGPDTYGIGFYPTARAYLHGQTPIWYPFVELTSGYSLGFIQFATTPSGEFDFVNGARIGGGIGTSRFLRPGIMLELALVGAQRYQSIPPGTQLRPSFFEMKVEVGLQFLLDHPE